jgi:hypothetical protein
LPGTVTSLPKMP